MRYELRTPVVGIALLAAAHLKEIEDLRFEFEIGANNRLVAVSVSVPAPSMKTSAGPGGEGVAFEYRVDGGEEEHKLALRTLQGLESHLAFASEGTIKGFDWQEMKWTIVPESEEERTELKIFGGHVTGRYPVRGSRLGVPLLDGAIDSIESRKDTVVPKAFYREAINEYDQQRYIQAFYNFYFVVEGMFGDGRSSERELTKQLMANDEYLAALSKAVTTLNSQPYHQSRMQQHADAEGLTLDHAAVTRLVVRLRNQLHHYSQNSTKKQGTPFDQREFESLAWFTMAIALNALLSRDFAKGPFYEVGANNLFEVRSRPS